MTAEEQKAYDEIMAEGREVSDAVKAHCHDQEAFAFARELSDNVIGGLGGDLSGSGIGAKSGQRLSFKHTGASVARPMLPDGMKALAPSGAAVVGQEMKPDPVALGQPALSLLDVIPVLPHATSEFAYMRQTVRTNNPVAPPRRHPGVLRSPRLQRPHRGHQRTPGSVAPQRPRIPKPHPLPRALTAAQRRTPHTRQCTLNYEEPVTLPSAATEPDVVAVTSHTKPLTASGEKFLY
jgi:hypothetical protein